MRVAPSLLIFCLLFLFTIINTVNCSRFKLEEATVQEIQVAFSENKLTSKELVSFYLQQIETLNPVLRSVLEINPDALDQAVKADEERELNHGSIGDLHGIPVLLKDSIGTTDKLNTTCGSYALLASEVPQDAGVVEKLRKAGAIIFGKASQNEWYGLRSPKIRGGWCARGGQAKHPYLESGWLCGSSSGSAIAVAANMVAVSLGSETDGSIICPANTISVVGIKPTVGLTSRAGVVPLSPRQDTIGPICRTVADAVYVLDAIVGFDPRDEATKEATKFIPSGGYKQFLKKDALKGKRLGVVKYPFLKSYKDPTVRSSFNDHLEVLRTSGATVLDNLEIANIDRLLDPNKSGETAVLLAEFKITVNQYFKELVKSPVRSLADVITFNNKYSALEHTEEYGQELLIASEATNGLGPGEIKTLKTLKKLSQEGFVKLMREHKLDGLVTIGAGIARVLATEGYPAISVPAGYDTKGMPFGITFSGLNGTEPKLIEIAYGFEQATLSRKPPFSSKVFSVASYTDI